MLRLRICQAIAATALAFAVAGLNEAQARTVLNFTVQGFNSPSLSTPAPNNDNANVSNPNNIPLPGTPGPGLTFSSTAPIDTVFTVQASAGTTEYFVSDLVSNNSGVTWNGFRLQLGTGVGANFSLGGPVIPEILFPDFDTPNLDPAPGSTAFATVNATPVELSLSNGTLPSGIASLLSIGFSIDTPDDLIPSGYVNFTLRQFPVSVPEPATLTLLSLGAIALMFARRRLAK
jgi:hypothetical protein